MINISTSKEQIKPIISHYFEFKLGHPGIIIDKRIPLLLLFIDCQCFLVKIIVLGKLSTSVSSHVQQIWIWSSSASDVFPDVGDGADGLHDVCGEGGAGTSCSCVNIMLPFFFLSEPAWRIRARRTSKSSFSWSVLFSDMHSRSKNTCQRVPLHPSNVSVHESPPLPKNWLWTTVGVLHTKCKNEIQTHSQGRHTVCGDVCEDENSPHTCMFVYTCTQHFSLFPFHALQPVFCRRWSLHTYFTLKGLLPLNSYSFGDTK